MVSVYALMAHPVFGSPSMAPAGRYSGAWLLRLAMPVTNGILRPPASTSSSVISNRSAPRATRSPGRFSSITTSRPSCFHFPAPGCSVTVYVSLSGFGPVTMITPLPGARFRRQGAAFVAGVIHGLVVIDGEHGAVIRLRRQRPLDTPRQAARLIRRQHLLLPLGPLRLQRFHLPGEMLLARQPAPASARSSRSCCSGVGSASCAPHASLPRSGTRPVSLMSAKNAFME